MRSSTAGRPSLAALGSATNRQSVAGRPSLAGAKRPTTAPLDDRKSRGASIGGRRSSVAPGKRGGQQDPRPIGDKQWKETQVISIINFLTEHHYEHGAISPQTLKSPTTKDFVNIVSFLLKNVDPNFKFNGKYEDEVPVVFKALGYKFTINKGPLQSVGAQHSWPPLLAALSWLVELLNYREAVYESDGVDGFESDDQDITKIFFDYLTRAYQSFLAGEDDTTQLDEQLTMIFESKNATVQQTVEALSKANADIGEQLRELTGKSPLEVAKEMNAELKADESKFTSHSATLIDYRTKMQKTLAEKGAETGAQEAELAQLTREIEAAKETVARQPYNPTDVKRMHAEREELERELHRLKEQKDVLNQQLFETNQKRDKKLEQLDGAVQRANSCSVRLQMIPAEAKHAQGRSFQIELQKQLLPSAPEALLSLEPSAVLVPALQRLTAEVQAELSAAQDERLAAEAAETTREEDAEGRREELQRLRASLEGLEKEEKLVREQLSRELEERNKEAKDLEAAILERRADGGSSSAENARKIAALRKEYEEFEITSHLEREKMYNDLASAMSMTVEHKEMISQQLKDLNEYCSGKTDLLQPLLARD